MPEPRTRTKNPNQKPNTIHQNLPHQKPEPRIHTLLEEAFFKLLNLINASKSDARLTSEHPAGKREPHAASQLLRKEGLWGQP